MDKIHASPSTITYRLTKAYNVKVYVYLRRTDLLLNKGKRGFSISLYVLRPSLNTI